MQIYMHTPYEMCSKKDIKSTIDIISNFILEEFGEEINIKEESL